MAQTRKTKGQPVAWGVDGCPAGWIYVALPESGEYGYGVVRNLGEIVCMAGDGDRVFVDIPIGLPYDQSPRQCDDQARGKLGQPRGSSVFPAPAREALGASSYEDACDRNKNVTGKKVSRQTYGILPKVHEVDDLVRHDEKARRIVQEVHPELCFWAFNERRALLHNKKKPEGRGERLAILEEHWPRARDAAEKIRDELRDDNVAPDDIVDAMVAALTARHRALCRIPDQPQTDAAGLPMQMTFACTGSALERIDWITVEGFRSIARLEKLRLGPVNLLIGANGAGKSNLIDVFALLRALRLGRVDKYVAQSGGANRNLHFGSKVTKQIGIEVSFGCGDERHQAVFEPTDNDKLLYSESGGSSTVRERLDRWRVYHFHDAGSGAPIHQTSDLDDNLFLRENAGNLAAFLYRLKKKEAATYNRIRLTFRVVAPFFDDFVLEPRALDERTIRLEWRHCVSDAYFDSSTLSDGSLRFLALATLLLQPVHLRPSVIVVDEPELGLHPHAIAMLCSLIRSVSVETQVILTTQSPLVVDQFDPQDVVVVDRVDGKSVFERLSADRLDAWLKEYSLGDLWVKNELGGCSAYEGDRRLQGNRAFQAHPPADAQLQQGGVRDNRHPNSWLGGDSVAVRELRTMA